MITHSIPLIIIFASVVFGLSLPFQFHESPYMLIDTEHDQAPLYQDSHSSQQLKHGRLVNDRTSLTLLYQNNLNSSDDQNHIGAILLDHMGQHELRDACEEIGESMLSFSTLTEHKEDFLNLLSYLSYTTNQTSRDQRTEYYFRDGVLSGTKDSDDFKHYGFPSQNIRLPALCTQTSFGSSRGRTSKTKRQFIGIHSGGNLYIGFRDQKSFRFLGIPFADPPTRFAYARPFSGSSRTIHATDYGPRCPHMDGGSENCLYLNIQTPYIPKMNSTVNLRPVLFYIHGDDFVAGISSDSVTDGGNLASREDIVVVTFNYRLSPFGILGKETQENSSTADQILALQWTTKNIAQFGGDPQRITIMGEGSGARSVKTLLSSPAAMGMFHGAIAISDSSMSQSYQADGNIYTSKPLPKSTSTANVPVMVGIATNDGVSLVKYPSENVKSELEGVQDSLGLSTTEALKILSSDLFASPNTGNVAFDAFSIAQHIAKDQQILCPNQGVSYALASTGRSNSYYFETQRTINNSPLPFIFGNLGQIDDSIDLDAAQLISAYFAEFIRSGQPNPDPEYITARGYKTTLDVINAFDPWQPVRDSSGKIQLLDFPPETTTFRDLEQCDFLGFPIDYLLSG
ncbi:Alpha/Beta hydrolase protein [Aspergillus unguis]